MSIWAVNNSDYPVLTEFTDDYAGHINKRKRKQKITSINEPGSFLLCNPGSKCSILYTYQGGTKQQDDRLKEDIYDENHDDETCRQREPDEDGDWSYV